MKACHCQLICAICAYIHSCTTFKKWLALLYSGFYFSTQVCKDKRVDVVQKQTRTCSHLFIQIHDEKQITCFMLLFLWIKHPNTHNIMGNCESKSIGLLLYHNVRRVSLQNTLLIFC